MRLKLILVLALILILSSLLFLTRNNVQASVKVPPFAFEGEQVPIKITLDGDVDDIRLEEYEFHYIMHPDIAPEPDTWPHNKQMGYMLDVQEGKLSSYVPNLEDENIKEILDISPMKSHTLSLSDSGEYTFGWNATHGRIFFRLKAGDKYVGDLYTTRVHCRHIDMRSFEKLKDTLEAMSMPIEHSNPSMVKNVFDRAYSIYTEGHSPRFMLKHHEYSTDGTNFLFESLRGKIDEGDLEGAENLRKEILKKLRENENLFYKLEVHKEKGVLSLDINDNINNFSFYDDPNTEVYIKRINSEEEDAAIMTEPYGQISKHDPSHMDQSIDKEKLVEGAQPLDRVGGSYQIKFSNDFEGQDLEAIVIYGAGQRYYLKRVISI